jgi:hypothetical protein
MKFFKTPGEAMWACEILLKKMFQLGGEKLK